MKRIIFLVLSAVLLSAVGASAKRMSDLKIYINPGHGGYTSNDRPIHLYPFAVNDTLGYWESKSNLYKGLHMYHILDSLGATPYISRIKNTEDDDRSLSGIAAEANALGVDLFFSIHSNAGENVNYPLMLYREQVIGTPRYPENVTLSQILGENLYSNQLPVWTHKLQIAGDLTFYDKMWQGGLGVLRTLYVVGLLSEGGMHEHRPEAYRLMNDDYWWLEAWHFVHAIMEFYDTEDRFVTGNVAGIVYDDHNLREKDMPVDFHYFGRDQFAPVNDCYIELVDASGNVVQKRTTDHMYNGVFVFRNVAPGTYTLRTSHAEYYDTETQVQVTADEVTYNDIVLSMKRQFPLEVVEYSPMPTGEEVSCATTLEFEFNSDIDTESFERALTIEPPVEGYFTYSDNNHSAEFTPTTAFERSTHYTITLSTEVCHPDTRYAQNHLQQPLVFEFTTKGRNRMELIDQFPTDGGEVHYAKPTVEFRFDAPVDNTGIYDLITIKDSKGNTVAVNKRGCKFNQLSNGYGNAIFALSDNLTIGETYTVTLPATLRDREQLPMGEDVVFTFKAIDVTAEAGELTLYDGFETAAPFEYSVEESTGISATTPTCQQSTTAKFSGSYAARFGYTFADSHSGEVVWKYTGDTPLVLESSDEIDMYVFGDFNNHELYIGVTSGTDTKWLEVDELTFLGWRHYSVSLDELDPSFTYLLNGVKLTQNTSLITQKGAFYIDDISTKSGSAVTDITADHSDAPVVYYNLQGMRIDNPTSGSIVIRRQGNQATKVVYRE